MAVGQTWTSLVYGITWAANKTMAGIRNGGSGTIYIRRVGFINVQTGAVTGTLSVGVLRFITGVSSWTPTTTNVVTTAHDSNNTALSSITIGYAVDPSGSSTSIVKYYSFGNEEIIVGGVTLGSLCAIPYIGTIWTQGYGDSEVQPLTLRNNEVLTVFNTTGAVGSADIWFEYTFSP